MIFQAMYTSFPLSGIQSSQAPISFQALTLCWDSKRVQTELDKSYRIHVLPAAKCILWSEATAISYLVFVIRIYERLQQLSQAQQLSKQQSCGVLRSKEPWLELLLRSNTVESCSMPSSASLALGWHRETSHKKKVCKQSSKFQHLRCIIS